MKTPNPQPDTGSYPKLFERGPDGHNNALLNFSHDRMFGFVEGYRLAADILVEQIMRTGNNQDLLVFPIVFSYRHHIELRLKEIIIRGESILGNEVTRIGHKLQTDLWPLAKNVIQRLETGSNNPEEFKLLDHFIAELAAVDEGSTAFRYPDDIKGNNQLVGVDVINLRHLKECMDSCCDFLGAISDWIYATEDNIDEMRANMM